MVSFMQQLEQARGKLARRDADPLLEKLEATVRSMEAVSTVALLDLLGLPKTTGNGRRIAPSMRALGFVPIKSRRLMPGGWRDTVTRGWARPVREVVCKVARSEALPLSPRPVSTKDTCHDV